MNHGRLSLVVVFAVLSACEGSTDAERTAASLSSSPAPQPPAELTDFRPSGDPAAAGLWDRLGDPSIDESMRKELARHYEDGGFHAMSRFVSASLPDSLAERNRRAAVSSVTATPNPAAWLCPDVDHAKVYAEVARIDQHLNAYDVLAARAAAESAIGRLGPACPFLIEKAVATLAAAVFGLRVPTEEFELALRTLITSDVEMGYPWYGGSREWPYQLIAGAFLRRNDPASAVVASELALTRRQSIAGGQLSGAGKAQLHELA